MNILNEAMKVLKLNLKPFDLTNLTKKKTYLCALNDENLLLIYTGKARFINKDAVFINNLANDFDLKYKYFFTKSPLCSKAKHYLEEKGFHIHAIL
ncbi:TPA: tram-like protein [Campylobacter coli]|uniref:tram-like protein n=1 Tax=Campylobacter coli TaxID=195 RepID=UPI0009A921B1|nr:tram-like protein [Campylobacter coli]EAH6774518.1 tram-like protein [Campylobacter coli]EAH9390526.1 tram-like protein [Campylobacter coli]EAI0869377.1 tram-like protein [Campylobacter coli]EAI3245682.1 tram-like protein [Campylobacter coli]EAI5036414.1 tram-like protein [Campylobacter coli]